MTRPLAMWSGPRNISTAMMYSFASRPDCKVWDEPFYAWYLCQTGLEHPMRQQIIDAGKTSAEKITTLCCEPADKIFYQKHMTHHMLPGLDRKWINSIQNAFLIRKPSHVLASYTQKRDEVTLADIGVVAQAEIFDQIADHLGAAPVVIDTEQFLQNPRAGLESLCRALDIPFVPQQLKWTAGPKPYDGAWAPHWYNSVWQSTGFGAARINRPALPPHLQNIADTAQPYYQKLKQFAL
jgi:hypothetical protein